MEPRKFILRNDFVRTHLIAFLQKLDLSKALEVSIKVHQDKRSVSQNSRLWLLHSAAAKHIGCTAERIHEDMLCMVTGVKSEVRLPSGDLHRIPNKRSSEMGKKEFGEFMEQVEAYYISDLGVWLDKEAA